MLAQVPQDDYRMSMPIENFEYIVLNHIWVCSLV
jgi:hypothetical protein